MSYVKLLHNGKKVYVGPEDRADEILGQLGDAEGYTKVEATAEERSWFVRFIKRQTFKALLAQSAVHGSIAYEKVFDLFGWRPNRGWRNYWEACKKNGASNRSWGEKVHWMIIQAYKAKLLNQV